MNKNIKLAPWDKCTGCGACSEICTKGCIKMEYGNSLHAYPVIYRNVCVSCGMCENTCPVLHDTRPTRVNQKYYEAWHNDDMERLSSTSGGAGMAMVENAMSRGWYVCGAAMDEGFNLKHLVTNDIKEASLFKGSKYLQSDITGNYAKIKDLAKQGSYLLFIGTPCQVEGLKHYLGAELLKQVTTCGIICHGVNSPKVWCDFKSWLEEKYGSRLVSYQFRSKSHGWQRKKGGPNLRVAFVFESGKAVDQPAWKNLFHWWFGRHYMLRPSCLECDYRVEYRNSDITIGDFWGVEKVTNNADTFKGVSVVITSTEKGEAFIGECRGEMYCKELDAELSKKVLRGFVDNLSAEEHRQQIEHEKLFEKDYAENSFGEMVRKYPAQTLATRLIYLIRTKLGAK